MPQFNTPNHHPHQVDALPIDPDGTLCAQLIGHNTFVFGAKTSPDSDQWEAIYAWLDLSNPDDCANLRLLIQAAQTSIEACEAARIRAISSALDRGHEVDMSWNHR